MSAAGNNRPERSGLKKYTIALCITVGCIILLFSYVMRFEFQAVIKSNEEKGMALVKFLGNSSAEHLLGDDYFIIHNILADLGRSEPELAYAFILDKNGQLVEHTFNGQFPVKLFGVHNDFPDDNQVEVLEVDTEIGRIRSFAASIIAADRRIGTAVVGLSETVLTKRLYSVILLQLTLFAALLGTMAAGVYFLIRILRSELKYSLSGLEQCLQKIPPQAGADFNKAEADNIQSSRSYLSNNSFYKYVSGLLLEAQRHLEALPRLTRERDDQQSILQGLLKGIPDILIIYDSEGRIAAVNHAFEKYFWLDAQAIKGSYPDEVIDSKIGIIARTENDAIINGAHSINKEMTSDINGDEFIFHINRTPIKDEQGKVSHILSVMTDITGFKETQKHQELYKLYAFYVLMMNQTTKNLAQLLFKTRNNLTPDNGIDNNAYLGELENTLNSCRDLVLELCQILPKQCILEDPLNLVDSLKQSISETHDEFQAQGMQTLFRYDEERLLVRGNDGAFKEIWNSLQLSAFEAMRHENRLKSQLIAFINRDEVKQEVVVRWLSSCASMISNDVPGSTQLRSCLCEDELQTFTQTLVQPVTPAPGQISIQTLSQAPSKTLSLSVISKIVQLYGGSLRLTSPVPLELFNESDLKDIGDDLGPGVLLTIRLPMAKDPD